MFPQHISNTVTYKVTNTVTCETFYNAITQNNCFVKGSHIYDVYLLYKNNTHLNWLNKDRISILM